MIFKNEGESNIKKIAISSLETDAICPINPLSELTPEYREKMKKEIWGTLRWWEEKHLKDPRAFGLSTFQALGKLALLDKDAFPVSTTLWNRAAQYLFGLSEAKNYAAFTELYAMMRITRPDLPMPGYGNDWWKDANAQIRKHLEFGGGLAFDAPSEMASLKLCGAHDEAWFTEPEWQQIFAMLGKIHEGMLRPDESSYAHHFLEIISAIAILDPERVPSLAASDWDIVRKDIMRLQKASQASESTVIKLGNIQIINSGGVEVTAQGIHLVPRAPSLPNASRTLPPPARKHI